MPGAIYDQCGLEGYAAGIAAGLRAGDAVLLSGPLGAGKSVFCRALIRAACNDPLLEVPSPTYTLVQSYEAPRFALHHFDLWRLDGAAGGDKGLAELGLEEARAGVVLVEWPDRLGAAAPADALLLTLAMDPDDPARRVLVADDRRPRR